jgi:hypothetical protein
MCVVAHAIKLLTNPLSERSQCPATRTANGVALPFPTRRHSRASSLQLVAQRFRNARSMITFTLPYDINEYFSWARIVFE